MVDKQGQNGRWIDPPHFHDAIAQGWNTTGPTSIEQAQGKTSFNDTMEGIKKGVTGAVRGMFQTADAAGKAMGGNPGPLGEIAYNASQASEHAYNSAPADATAAERVAMGAGPVVGIDSEALARAARARDLGGAVAATAPVAGTMGLGKVMGGAVPAASDLAVLGENLPKVTVPLTGAMAGRMAEVPPGEMFSRGEVANAAQEHGVNLDLAQATESPLLKQAKNANRYSLASQGVYDAAQTKNLSALEQWANDEASQYAPDSLGREGTGQQLQAALKAHLEARKQLASNMYEQLDQELGGVPQDVSATVQDAASRILDENKAYYDQHPELKPTKAWAIIQDLAKQPKEGMKVASTGTEPGLIDAQGNPVANTKVVQAAVPKTATWSELHQLRSDLMDFYRNNPDVIKGRGEAWIQQMVSTIDQAMTSPDFQMTPEQLHDFRAANDVWESIKNTYDNPQSPYYHAIRAQSPSQIPNTLSKGSPELARSVRQTLSSLDDTGSLEGQFQRQFVEKLLNGKDGETLDLGGLNQRLKAIPQDHLEAMLGPEGAKNLRMLGKVASKITENANPSGTARVGVPAAEVTTFFHNPLAGAAELGTQYGGAKLMNSQWLLNQLTQPK
jgi:hypothetical protein